MNHTTSFDSLMDVYGFEKMSGEQYLQVFVLPTLEFRGEGLWSGPAFHGIVLFLFLET